MNRLALFICAALIVSSSLMFAETYFQQGFEESSSDTWAYTANQNRMIYWGRVNTTLGSASPYQGDWYWASWDLDNIPSALTFDNLNLPLGYSYQLSFYYYTAALNPATEYSRYSVSIDGGITWQPWVDLLPNSNVWTLVNVDLPAYAPQLMLKVEAKHDGMTKFAHWDNFVVSRDQVEPSPPLVYDVSAAQRTDGSGLVDVSYDLFDANNDLSTISVLLATGIDGAYSYSPQQGNLTGDLGSNIALGTGKSIVWNARAEGIDYDGSNYRIRVIADDGTNPQVAMPVFDPPGGTYTSSQSVSITCATSYAQIYYTMDGSEPDQSSEMYTIPIMINSPTMLKAKAYRVGWQASEAAVVSYVGLIPSNFVFVEGGTFNNGTSDVTVSSFYIDKYELTQAGYLNVMGVNPSYFTSVSNGPVEQVSWFNSIAYCNKRSIQEELTPCYSYLTHGTDPNDWPAGWNTSDANHSNVSCNWAANGYRLPTEMEWMFAARGGNQTQDHTYSGSSTIEDVAWYSANSGSTTHQIGTRAANELGLYDMSGNVFEWIWDIYGNYPIGSQNNPIGASSGSGRVVRGGSWYNTDYICNVMYRFNYTAINTDYHLGLRIIRPISWVATPTISHQEGSYPSSICVTITCATDSATIHYTVDGSEPSEYSLEYSHPILITSDKILKVKSFMDNTGPSATIAAEYSIDSFALVPGGTFIMGRISGSGNSNELPAHSVTVSPFYLGKCEITYAEHMALTYPDVPLINWSTGNFPSYHVSWYQTLKYCNLRSISEGFSPAYTLNGSTDPANWGSPSVAWDSVICNWNVNGYRLPTEAEWEYAAREGTNNPDYLYSGSDDIDAVAWYSGNNSTDDRKAVGTKAPNGLGIYDMSGNIAEWCWDWGGDYSPNPLTNPTGPASGSYKVIRNGCWDSGAGNCRVVYRTQASPALAIFMLGFRICRSAQ